MAKNVWTAFVKDLDCIRLALYHAFVVCWILFLIGTYMFFLQQEIFGLRYLSHSRNPRWVDLSRPLKRQLDKYSCHFSLYLRVMYYINNIAFIKDETTRLVLIDIFNHYIFTSR